MRAGTILAVAVVLSVTSGTAQGDPAADARVLVTAGEALAKQGRFSEAIDKFRAAEKASPSARHDCYIALAYRRLEQWGAGRLHAERCSERATAADPAPVWMATVRRDVDDGIARAGLVKVTLVVTPAELAGSARIRLRALGEDPFAPRAVYLAPGDHDATVETEGREPTSHRFTVKGPGDETATLAVPTGDEPPAAPTQPAAPAGVDPAAPTSPAGQIAATPAPPPSRGPWPWITASIAGAAAVTGVVLHVQALGTKDDAESDATRYDDLLDRFERQRALAIGLYAVAAAAGGVTLYLWLRSPTEAAVSVGIVPVDGGAVVGIGWER